MASRSPSSYPPHLSSSTLWLPVLTTPSPPHFPSHLTPHPHSSQVRTLCQGIRLIRSYQMKMVPVADMTTVLASKVSQPVVV